VSCLQTSLLVVISFILYLVEPIPSLTASHGLPGSPRPPRTLSHSLCLRTKSATHFVCAPSLLLIANIAERRFRWT
jgi:hypothetical protein